jgi:hypothetical protein
LTHRSKNHRAPAASAVASRVVAASAHACFAGWRAGDFVGARHNFLLREALDSSPYGCIVWYRPLASEAVRLKTQSQSAPISDHVAMERYLTFIGNSGRSFSKSSVFSATALLRLLPLLFPVVFVSAAVIGSISVLYVAVAMHLIIIGAENTIGRILFKVPIAPLLQGSTLFEDACLLFWPALHLIALGAAFYLIAHTEPSMRQVFALGAIFGYSINVFSATAGHELLHQNSRAANLSSDVLYAAILYPHLPTVHFASHHKWAGLSQDCQTPRAGQQIYGYLAQALSGGLRIAATRETAKLDPRLRWRVVAVALCITTIALAGSWQTLLFFLVQGAFTFVLIETLNYVQHYAPIRAYLSTTGEGGAKLANQDLNFISRCILFNLPLHASHHVDENCHCTNLAPILEAPAYCWGYWTSFWLAWIPPLWNLLHGLEARRSVLCG